MYIFLVQRKSKNPLISFGNTAGNHENGGRAFGRKIVCRHQFGNGSAVFFCDVPKAVIG